MKALRREIILGGALSILWGVTDCRCQGADDIDGCFIDDASLANKLGADQSGFSFDVNNDPVSGGSGDHDFDRALAQTLSKISDLYGVLPGFAFFQEDANPNAFASRSQRLHRSDGSVVFGKQLLAKLLTAVEHPAIGVAAVCAHEFGHILQYKKGLDNQLVGPTGKVKRLELHADFLAGYYAGRRKAESSDYAAAVFANTQFNAGDNMLNNPQHHGTPEERGQAVVSGFKASYEDRKSLEDAISTGLAYVLSIQE